MMDPDFTLKGQPRRWYAYPLVGGVVLIAIGIFLLAIEPAKLLAFAFFLFRVAVALVAFVCMCLGIVLTLIGLDLARGLSNWQHTERIEHWRGWIRAHWPGRGGEDRP
jgi:hypothetical protein